MWACFGSKNQTDRSSFRKESRSIIVCVIYSVLMKIMTNVLLTALAVKDRYSKYILQGNVFSISSHFLTPHNKHPILTQMPQYHRLRAVTPLHCRYHITNRNHEDDTSNNLQYPNDCVLKAVCLNRFFFQQCLLISKHFPYSSHEFFFAACRKRLLNMTSG